jgi:hypothetical protein
MVTMVALTRIRFDQATICTSRDGRTIGHGVNIPAGHRLQVRLARAIRSRNAGGSGQLADDAAMNQDTHEKYAFRMVPKPGMAD